MKQDIRKILKKRELYLNKLPDSHREEFVAKLKSNQFKTSPKRQFTLYRVAAILTLMISLGYLTYKTTSFQNTEISKPPPIVAQIQTLEKEFLKNIEIEWRNFEAVAYDKKLVNRFEQRLSALDDDYQNLTIEFKKDPNNIHVIQNLIQNLQTRLQLLQDIKEHITILNKENQRDEVI